MQSVIRHQFRKSGPLLEGDECQTAVLRTAPLVYRRAPAVDLSDDDAGSYERRVALLFIVALASTASLFSLLS